MQRPLANHLRFHVCSPEQACSELTKIYSKHSLELTAGGQIDAYLHHAPLSAISLNFLEYGAEVKISAESLDSYYLIQVPLTGSSQIQSGNKHGTSAPGTAFITAHNRQLEQRISADARLIQIKIDRSAMEQQLSALIARPITRPLEFEMHLQLDSPNGASWWRSIQYLINEFEQEQSLLISGPAVAGVEQAVITNLLYAQPHTYSEALLTREASIAPAHVKRAEEYMRTNITTPITMADLVTACGVSERALHEGFKRFRQTTPMNHLRAIRLENVRRDLLAAEGHNGVTAIATQWGFTQLGRFASLYKKRYGESPSETLRKQRLQH